MKLSKYNILSKTPITAEKLFEFLNNFTTLKKPLNETFKNN